jgi:hypothetical protein
MMTLENSPPTLDTCAEEKDQYKNYGKTFRYLIGLTGMGNIPSIIFVFLKENDR